MSNPELVALAAALVSVGASFTAGLFAFLNAWTKQRYDADRIRVEAKVDELTRDNADLKQQLADERRSCNDRIAQLEGRISSLIDSRNANPQSFPNR